MEKEISILLLGETGVGKSTFINSFANYLNFPQLNNALEKPICLIPTSFTLKGKAIKLGEDSNECNVMGQSATQSCKSYEFQISNVLVRLIDTPGLDDTRGMEQNKLNLENILTGIGNHDHLHAICILLNPNQTRLTPSFEYVITQLLTQLDKSASQNIVFIYTKSRSTFYSPGDSEFLIRKVLDKIKDEVGVEVEHILDKNVFCFDNESFRFLLALKNGIVFNDSETKSYEESWSKSVEKSRSLLNFVAKNDIVYDVQKTVSIFNARKMISSCLKPTINILNLIDLNLIQLESRRKEVEQNEQEISKMRQRLSVPVIERQIIELDEARVVCNSTKCQKYVELTNGEKVLANSQKCIDRLSVPSYIWNTLVSGLAVADIYMAGSITNTLSRLLGDCKVCKCPYKDHEVHYYETKIIEREDEEAAQNLERILSSKEKEEFILTKLSVEIKKYGREKKSIIRIITCLACYLELNSLISNNDLLETRILLEIQKLDNPRLIQSFKETLEYIKTMKELNRDAVRSYTPKDLINLVDELFNLPLFGDKIKEEYQLLERVTKRQNDYNSTQVEVNFDNSFIDIFD